MSLTSKRQLPKVNTEQINSVQKNGNTSITSSNNPRNKGVRFNNDVIQRSVLSNQQDISKTGSTKQQLNDSDGNHSFFSKQDPFVQEAIHSRLDRHLQEIEREIKRNTGEQQHQQGNTRALINDFPQQRKLTTSIHNEDDPVLQARRLPSETNKQTHKSQSQNSKRQLEENEMNRTFLTQQNSANLLECAKSIRENVSQFKDQLMRNEVDHRKQIQKDENMSPVSNRRQRPEQDHLQLENEYLIHQQTMLSKSATLTEMINFKNELNKSERQREQLSDHLETLIKKSDEKDKLVSKMSSELKEMTENCDTFERQNIKLQHDLTLALERLEEMTDEAERFAQESQNLQKNLADSEQKREESQIQGQETIKQWTARVKKLEKDIDRHKLDSTQLLEKNEEFIKEINLLKTQNTSSRERITQLETELNQANTNHNRLDEQFKRNENDIVQLRTIRSSQETDITTFKRTINELESQLSSHRQRLSQIDKEKQTIQQILHEETNHRTRLDTKLKQTEQNLETAQQHITELENERKNLLEKVKELSTENSSILKHLNNEKTKLTSLETNYEEIEQKLETTKSDYTRGMKTLQFDYENKIEILKLQLSDEKTRSALSQRHELEYKKDIERLEEKAAKYQDEATQGQSTLENLTRQIKDKSRLIEEFETKLTKLTVEATNQKNQIMKKESDYQNSLHNAYNDIIYCTECLSNASDQPLIIEPVINSYNDIEAWLSKVKARLAWLKQELEIHQQQKSKLRQDLNSALLDCETDRKYFAAELAKREVMINELTNHQDFGRQGFSTQLPRVEGYAINENEHMQVEYDRQRVLTEDENDHMDDRYRQFQTMVDSVKRDLYTAKVQLSV